MTEEPLDADVDAEPDAELDDPWHDQLVDAQETYGAPEVLASVALVLAIASFFGWGLMNGTAYIVPLLSNFEGDNSTRIVLGTLLGAAMAMIPVGLGWRASSRLLDSDPRWVATVARTAIVLGLASGALRLVVAFIEAAHDGPSGFTRL